MNKVQLFWDKQAKKYDAGEKHFEAVYREVIPKTRKYLDPADEVLDFGCATGTKTLELAPSVNHIHGLDISGEMIDVAIKKKDKVHYSNISFSRGTIYQNDFEKASFDKIIAFGIIHLLEDSEMVMQRIHELLKPEGIFISTIACFKDKTTFDKRMEFILTILFKRLGFIPLHLNIFSTKDVAELIARQNFQIIEEEQLFNGITTSFIIARKLPGI